MSAESTAPTSIAPQRDAAELAQAAASHADGMEGALAAAREALRRSNELLRATFEQAGIGIGLLDLDGRYSEVNAKFAAIVGYSPEALRELSVWDITHPDDRDLSRAHVDDLLARRVAEVVQEKRYLRQDGSAVWSRTAVSVLEDASGRPQRLISVIEDITERKEAEEALRRSNEFNRSIVESTRDCIKTLTLDGRLLWLSDAGQRAICIDDASKIIGTSWVDLWNREDRDAVVEAVRAASEGAIGSFVGHYPVRGASRWWDVVVTPIRGDDGRPERLLAVSRDITERVESEQERRLLLESERAARAAAERASRMKDEFLATLSHELRTPLSAILGWVHVLRSGRASQEDAARGLDAIERNARVQAQLIEALLDMSRITSGKMRLEMQPLDLAAVVGSAFETIRAAAGAKRIDLEKALDPEVGPVAGDPPRLQQVVWNLLSNAIKFTPEGGHVKLSLGRADGFAEIRVEDDGAGIEAAFMPHLFDRFRQADGSMARRHGGLGLGLSIVKHVVDMHGGEVFAESAGPGRGSAFTVRLPLAGAIPRAEGAAPSPAASTLDADLCGLRLLVVEDDSDGRELVQRLLSERGADVVVAASAMQALDVLARDRFDVIVSDIGMPGMDGYEMLRRARAVARHGDLRAIALTAFARPEDRTRALSAGFRAHVAKPVDPAGLISAVLAAAGR